jgi:hypothetical protein
MNVSDLNGYAVYRHHAANEWAMWRTDEMSADGWSGVDFDSVWPTAGSAAQRCRDLTEQTVAA